MVPWPGGMVILKVDMLVQGTDVPKGMTFRQAARKSVASCVSDFACKGVRPSSFMASIGLTRRTALGAVRLLGQGFRDAERLWGVTMVGGDTNEAKELVIDCAMVGFGGRIVRRSGARPGDVVIASGRFGLPPCGLKIIQGGTAASERFRKSAVASVMEPSPNLEGGIALSKYLTASIDSSDGLARSLHQLSDASGVGMELDGLPIERGIASFASRNGLDASELVLYGGEEYLVVGTMRRSSVTKAALVAQRRGAELVVMGTVTSRAGEVVMKDDTGLVEVEDRGWVHLG